MRRVEEKTKVFKGLALSCLELPWQDYMDNQVENGDANLEPDAIDDILALLEGLESKARAEKLRGQAENEVEALTTTIEEGEVGKRNMGHDHGLRKIGSEEGMATGTRTIMGGPGTDTKAADEDNMKTINLHGPGRPRLTTNLFFSR